MPVNNYLKDCKYSLNNLDNYIYLYQFNEPILNFITDDGESNATATSIKGSSQRLYCNSVQYQSTTSIDNRFAFDNTLTVTLSEHSKVSHYSIIQTLLNGNWMVVFKNTDGDAFVVNAEYPVMVSYSYVINDEKTPNNLTITFRALQNVPTVNLKGSVAFSSTLCDNYCEYNISRIETLKMIDMNKATIDVDNDGFSLTEIGEGNLKTIEFNPTSMSFTDSFDGREFSQTLTFQIPFDSYRYYFHYNLLEFLDNRYYALIKTTDDNNILGGFRQGLFPSYTISTADNNNIITITLTAKYTNYSVLGSDTMSTTTNDGMFYKPVMGECVDKLYVWTLIEQYNANGVATNGYYCLSGFEDIYNDYTILGTYDKYDTRFGFKLIDYNIDCSEGCKINNLPSSIQFENSGETKCYTLDTTCSIVWEWNSTAIDFTYDEITKEMCVTSKVDEGTFNIKATTTDGTIQYATVVIGNGGITGDTTTTINITAEGQRLTVIPVKGMSNVKSLTSSLQYQVNQNGNGYEVTVPENTREETKTYTITILYKDNSIETVSIIQERIYYIITSSEETECYGQNLYYVDKKYKKYTENGELIFVENIKGNQKETDSVICLDFDEKVSGCTNCFEGFVYTLYEYKKNGSTIATRYEKTTSSCTNNASTEYVVNTEKAKCVDGTEYYVEEMYGANCNGGNNVKLYPVIERTSIVEATDSNVCDVIDPNASGGTLYRWVDTNETYCLTNTAQTNCTSSTTNTYCDGYNLFEQTTYYVDALCNGNWVQSGNTQTILKEANSTRCGYVEPDTPDDMNYNCEPIPVGDFSFTVESNFMQPSISINLNEQEIYLTGFTSITHPTYTTSHTLSDLGINELTSCRRTFENWNNSSSFYINNFFNTSNVTDMSWMFSMCSSQGDSSCINLKGWNTSNVTTMRGMFAYAKEDTDGSVYYPGQGGYKYIYLPFLNTSKVTDMSYMFAMSNLTKIIDVRGWDISNVNKYENMFYWGTRNTNSVTIYLGDVTQETYNWWYDRIKVDGNLTNATIEYNIIEEGGGSTSGDTLSFEFSGDAATYKLNGTRYTATTSPYTIEVTDLTNCDDTFNGSSLTNLISFPDTSNVTKMRYMFRRCSGLTSLDLTSFNTSNVDDMNDMFYECTKLSSLNITSFNTSKVTDMSSMFYKCMILSTLDVSNFNTTSVDTMTNMFCYCENLTSLDLSSFNTSNLKYMSWMFEECKSLQTLDVSSWDVGDHIINKSGVFTNCTSLRTLRIKQGTRDWWYARLTDANIQNNVTITEV